MVKPRIQIPARKLGLVFLSWKATPSGHSVLSKLFPDDCGVREVIAVSLSGVNLEQWGEFCRVCALAKFWKRS